MTTGFPPVSVLCGSTCYNPSVLRWPVTFGAAVETPDTLSTEGEDGRLICVYRSNARITSALQYRLTELRVLVWDSLRHSVLQPERVLSLSGREDARLFWVGQKPWMSYSRVAWNASPLEVYMAVSPLTGLTTEQTMAPAVVAPLQDVVCVPPPEAVLSPSPMGSALAWEKNWTFTTLSSAPGMVLSVYHVSPLTVLSAPVRALESAAAATGNGVRECRFGLVSVHAWKLPTALEGLTLRGGTPPLWLPHADTGAPREGLLMAHTSKYDQLVGILVQVAANGAWTVTAAGAIPLADLTWNISGHLTLQGLRVVFPTALMWMAPPCAAEGATCADQFSVQMWAGLNDECVGVARMPWAQMRHHLVPVESG